MASPQGSLDSVHVDFYASASKSCQAKHSSAASKIQDYIDALQEGLGLPMFSYANITETGGSFSSNDDDITK